MIETMRLFFEFSLSRKIIFHTCYTYNMCLHVCVICKSDAVKCVKGADEQTMEKKQI